MYGKFLLYKISLLHANHTTNMYIYGHHRQFIVCDWPIKKIFSKIYCGQINWNLEGSTYGRFCIKFPQNKMIGMRLSLSPLSLEFLSS